MTTKREKLWMIAHDLIEGLGPHFNVPVFGNLKKQALSIAYTNIMGDSERGISPALSDAEVDNIMVVLIRDLNAP